MSDYISYCYAKALFESSIDKIDFLLKDVSFIINFLKEDSTFITFISNPTISLATKLAVLTVFKETLSEVFFNFINIIILNKRTAILLKTLQCFLNIVKDYRREIDVEIISYSSLSEKDMNNIVNYLSSSYDKVNIVSAKVDNAILGGFIIKFESFIMDMSLLNRLDNLFSISKISICNS